jgi:hypothetical protein
MEEREFFVILQLMPELNLFTTFSSICLVLVLAWLALIFFFPEKWNALVQKEYTFYSRKKWIPEKIIRFQRDFSLGNGLKITLVCLGFALLVCLITILRLK